MTIKKNALPLNFYNTCVYAASNNLRIYGPEIDFFS